MPNNSTASGPVLSYADRAPPYPVDLDFDWGFETSPPPSYETLGYPAGEDGAGWQAWADPAEPAGDAGDPPLPHDMGRCSPDLLLAVTGQLLVVFACFYAGLGSYVPLDIQ
ncbi:hypothetical protein [Comamonas antarctica]|uniref:Uncharacterized protein n=1 Tax=Comamonas antarctica TaxID=2743470 RepID=A0A6N1X3W3_9BURK|nr:hypothetical protein [Comamonas antarctica]QKV52450.1 hypothetical protein HUK68_05760 [Comamonas antarctica]